MFNRYIDASCHNHSPSKVEYREFRAPTDDSIRLAREYENKALNKILGQIVFGENNIEFVKGQLVYVQRNPQCLTDDIFLIFKLNGKNYDIKVSIQDYEYIQLNKNDPKTLVEFFVKKISEEIAREILKTSCSNKDFEELLSFHFRGLR
jgi:hypothetical protein